MYRFPVNYAPLMTSFLVKETGVFRDDPIVIVDVGARGGIGREWEALGDQIRAYAFEPDEEECRQLAGSAPAHLTYIPRALGRTRGRETFYQTALSDSAGLYQPRMDYLGRMLNRDNGVTVGEREIEVSSLDDVLAEYKVPTVDFIKIDVEGAELDVLKGAEKLLSSHSPLGILSEIRFHAEIGSPPFSVFDVFMREHGLRLFDLQFNYQSRRAMPYPGLQHYRRPSGEKFFAYTSRGQAQDGDALYFRDLLLPSDAPLINQVSAARILKMCVFMEIFSLNDCAAELLLADRDRINELTDCSPLLDLLASGICGTPTTFEAFQERYFTEPTPTLQTPFFEPDPATSRGGWLRRLLGGK
jgi:FkbM family methyltransferase